MNVSFGNISTGNAHFGIVEQTKVESPETKNRTPTLQQTDSQPSALDPLLASEPMSEVPAVELTRDDALGRLVSSVFNLPAPPMPEFRG